MAGPANLYEIIWWWAGAGQSGAEKWVVQRAGTNPATIFDSIIPIMQKRAQLLSSEYALIGGRVSQYSNGTGARTRRLSEFRVFNYPGTLFTTPTGSTPLHGIATKWDLLLHCFDATGKLKLQYFGGVPRDCFEANAFVITPQWNAIFPDYCRMVMGAGFGWIGETQLGVAGNPIESGDFPFLVTDYVVNNVTGRVLITLGTAITYVGLNGRDFQVHMSWPGENPLDGRHAVKMPLDPITGLIVPNKVETLAAIGARPHTLAGTGALECYGDVYYTMGDGNGGVTGRMAGVKAVERKRGNSFPAGRGRLRRIPRW